MKFISKNSNLHIILQPGQPANNFTQTPPVPALSVRFQNGQADIHDEALIEKMKRHPAFNQDFIAVDETGTDPYAHLRATAEPQHVTTEILFGHPTGRSASPISSQMSPEVKKILTDQATLIAAEMVKQQMPSLMAAAIEAVKASQTPAAPEVESTTDSAPVAPVEEGAPTEKPSNKPKARASTVK